MSSEYFKLCVEIEKNIFELLLLNSTFEKSVRLLKRNCCCKPVTKESQSFTKTEVITSCRCSFDPPNLEFEHLRFVDFPKFDVVLQRQFYDLCFPVIRKKLHSSSKKLTNLGEKPKVYIACRFESKTAKIQKIFKFNFKNAIIQVSSVFEFYGSSRCLREILKFTELYPRSGVMTQIEEYNDDPNFFKNKSTNYEKIVPQLPQKNIRPVVLKMELPENWEKYLCEKIIRHSCTLIAKRITNYEALWNFLDKQAHSGLGLFFLDLTLEEFDLENNVSFNKYFELGDFLSFCYLFVTLQGETGYTSFIPRMRSEIYPAEPNIDSKSFKSCLIDVLACFRDCLYYLPAYTIYLFQKIMRK